MIEDLAGVPVRVELASEYRYRSIPSSPDTLVIIISQSGETADSLAALRVAKERGAVTLAVVNVMGSTIAREADHTLYTLAGPEIAVATTKAYSAQLIAMDVLAVQLAAVRGAITEEQTEGYLKALAAIPDQIGRVLEEKQRLQWFSSKIANTHDIFFIGRGLDYAISLEGSLNEARDDQPDRAEYAGHRGADPEPPVRKDGEQHAGVQEPRRVSDGADHEREFLRGGFGELHRVCAEDRRAFHRVPGDRAPAAAGILYEREPGPGCGQA